MKSPLAEAGKRTAAACVGLLVILAVASCDTGTTATLPTPSETTAPPPATMTAVATATQPPTAAPTDTQAPSASAETPTPAGAAGATPASTPSAQAGVNIQEVDFDFQPKVVTVPVGTKITWTNIGPTEHTVADSTLKLFSSNILNKGDTFSYTPTQPGTIQYLCTLHPDMVGTIVVVK